MISEGPSPIEPLPTRLQDALRTELRAAETVVAAATAGRGAALAASDRRLMTLFEPGVLEAGGAVRVQSYPWDTVRELELEERPAGGRLRWRVGAEPVTFDVPSHEIAKYRRVVARLKEFVPAAGPARSVGSAMEQKPCPKCGSGLPGGAAFCVVCGLQALDVCWECGEPLQGDWAYCPRCGTNASETGVVPCPSCREPVSRGWRYCARCGAEARPMCVQCGELMRREWQFCPECGASGAETGGQSDGETGRPGSRETGTLAGHELAPSPRLPVSPSQAEADALVQEGVAAYEADRLDEAIRLFRQALELDPANARYHTNLAVALDEREMDDEAVAEYQRAIELDPRQTTALINLGYLYSEQERYDEAREVWEQVIRVDPRSAEAKEARDNLQHLDEL